MDHESYVLSAKSRNIPDSSAVIAVHSNHSSRWDYITTIDDNDDQDDERYSILAYEEGKEQEHPFSLFPGWIDHDGAVGMVGRFLQETNGAGEGDSEYRGENNLSGFNGNPEDESATTATTATTATMVPTTPTAPTVPTAPTESTGMNSNSGKKGGLGNSIMWIVVIAVLSYFLWRLYRWYRDKYENDKQAYRMAQANRVLGDMQMVSTVDADNELI